MNLSILKPFLLLLLAGFLSEFAAAQPGAIHGRSRGKDFATITLGDSISFDGELEKPRSWPAEVRIKRPGQQEFEVFRAGEATALVVNNVQHYRALPVELGNGETQYLFVEVLSRGKVNFYEFPKGKNRFMIFDGEFTPLTRSNYREVLGEMADPCQTMWCSWQRTAFNRRSLRFFFDQYNRGTLNTRFPMMNAGFSMQYNYIKMRVPGYYSTPIRYEDFKLNSSFFSPVMFVHIPFFSSGKFGLDLQVARHSYIASGTVEHTGPIDYIKDSWMDLSWYQGGAAIRYTGAWTRFEPYVAGGINYMHPAGFKGKISYFQIAQNVYAHFYSEEIFPEPGALLGFSIRQGLQYSFLPRSFVATEWGYIRYLTVNNSGYQFNNLFFSLSLNLLPW